MKNLVLLFTFLCLGIQQITAQCSPDVTPPVPVCVGTLQRDVPSNTAEFITVSAADFNAGSTDACTPSNELGLFIELAPQSATPPSTTTLQLNAAMAGTHTVILWVVDAAGNVSTCENTLQVDICQATSALICNALVMVQLGINGTYDLQASDILEGGPYCDYVNYTVKLDQTGPFVETLTLDIDDVGQHLVTVSNGINLCWGNITINPGIYNETCPQLHVDIATPFIRPCFAGKYYVNYANGSVFHVADTYVDVALDEGLEFTGSSLASVALGNNAFRFMTGDLAPGASGNFIIDFFTPCEEEVGITYCSEAHIFPDTICSNDPEWSGAIVSVTGRCEDDQVLLSIKNLGNAPTSPGLDYVVVEDVLMLTGQPFNLPGGGQYDLPAIVGTGATYRLEAQQEPGFPYGGVASVTIEGCGGLHPGLVTVFPTENSNPAISNYCRQSTASFDPNDKQALPVGVGEAHFIKPNTTIDYMIRFQNTGTDTAFNVVLVDSLSAFLSPASIRMGASSHPYTFSIDQGNILRIKFEDIQLPYQSINDAGSNGFVQFSIAQIPDNPDGVQIDNRAAIYFDFNAPIITNTTQHTIGTQFLESVSVKEETAGLPQLQVFPNPSSDVLYFQCVQAYPEPLNFTLTDVLGRIVMNKNHVTLPMTLRPEADLLKQGMYFFQFSNGSGLIRWTGTIQVR
ncbi:MAG: T9SS type A sorting domain-containing protein [Saprospiraceae bacterium]|nr:T9SS type A sorting domain-containing protein [Saprospiraceae bacterium]